MDQKTNQMLFALLRCAIRGTTLSEGEREQYSEDLLPALNAIAQKHDMAHLLALGLKQNRLLPERDAEIKKDILKAAYRYERLNYEFERLCQALESAQIPFLPLKGSVLRAYYPEPWMRTSCDIDVLVHEEDTQRAVSTLTEHCGYTGGQKDSHDVSLFAPGKEHIELHYDLVEDGIANASSRVLANVWETSGVRAGHNFWYEMSDEMFYFYHIAHMAKHFENGGCGIRPFLDLWIMEHEGANRQKRDELLEQGELLKFARAARKLSELWFGKGERDDLLQQMENYILRGGVYGTNENRISIQRQKEGGALRYAISQIIIPKIIIPYDTIKFYYPILQTHRWLTPVMQVRRWFRLIFSGPARRTVHELKYNRELPDSEAEAARRLLEHIGL